MNLASSFRGTEPDETYRERNRWLVEALRSGDYQQGMHTLEITREDGTVRHCCLGVACRVAMAHGVTLGTAQHAYTAYPDSVTKTKFINPDNDIDTAQDVAPEVVRAWFGWTSTNPLLKDRFGFPRSAATMNDSGESFDTIADAFEATYLG